LEEVGGEKKNFIFSLSSHVLDVFGVKMKDFTPKTPPANQLR
jgi:hypothetical protein